MSSKAMILKYLEENRGRAVSGNDLAETLGISRTAVWKAVHQLEEEGYSILAANKKGYQLADSCDILSEQSIRPWLKNEEFYPVVQVHKLLESTNQTAKNLANTGFPSGTAVLADQQSGGRGRLGRSFNSPAGAGIYMSLLLRLPDPVETAMLITSGAGVAVCRAIQKICGLEAQIKWVNDVYLDGRKLCGILTEASMNFESGALDYLVVGIGVNVSKRAFPPDLADTAIALEERLDVSVSRSRLAAEILNQMEDISKDLSERSFLAEYRRRSWILGQTVQVISSSGTEQALAVDINDQGHLIIRREDGSLKTLNTGEISIRRI